MAQRGFGPGALAMAFVARSGTGLRWRAVPRPSASARRPGAGLSGAPRGRWEAVAFGAGALGGLGRSFKALVGWPPGKAASDGQVVRSAEEKATAGAELGVDAKAEAQGKKPTAKESRLALEQASSAGYESLTADQRGLVSGFFFPDEEVSALSFQCQLEMIKICMTCMTCIS